MYHAPCTMSDVSQRCQKQSRQRHRLRHFASPCCSENPAAQRRLLRHVGDLPRLRAPSHTAAPNAHAAGSAGACRQWPCSPRRRIGPASTFPAQIRNASDRHSLGAAEQRSATAAREASPRQRSTPLSCRLAVRFLTVARQQRHPMSMCTGFIHPQRPPRCLGPCPMTTRVGFTTRRPLLAAHTLSAVGTVGLQSRHGAPRRPSVPTTQNRRVAGRQAARGGAWSIFTMADICAQHLSEIVQLRAPVDLNFMRRRARTHSVKTARESFSLLCSKQKKRLVR